MLQITIIDFQLNDKSFDWGFVPSEITVKRAIRSCGVFKTYRGQIIVREIVLVYRYIKNIVELIQCHQ